MMRGGERRYEGPHRTCLVVPSHKANVLEKAKSLAVDELILDLEDAVPPESKDEALANAISFLNGARELAKRLVVRVNDATTPRCHRDVLALVEQAGDALDCIMLPMSEQPAHVHFLHWLLAGAEAARGQKRPIGLIAQLETPRAMIAAPEIAAASPRVEALTFGPQDYTKSIGTFPDLSPRVHEHVLMRIVTAARAAGVRAMDGPYLEAGDLDGYRERCRLSRACGAHGIWCVHPAQIPIANEMFGGAR